MKKRRGTRPAKGRSEKRNTGRQRRQGARKGPYDMRRETDGLVTVTREPVGNRSVPTNCGTMPSMAAAQALIRHLQRAESVLDDLFLEATDDGIEALEAILERCREAAMRETGGGRGQPHPRGRPRAQPEHDGGRSDPPSPEPYSDR